uniref:Paraneoplastic antigen Ma-like C-terminal domain-containing protein n=1 Tax=Cyprinus carpio TaxID=7962 RepID=A0A8C1PA13_CYPCA
ISTTTALKNWCRREELDDAHSLMVLIPEDVANAQIEEALGTIKALGRVLKGPALAVLKAVRTADPEVSPARCLEAIESAFGSAET